MRLATVSSGLSVVLLFAVSPASAQCTDSDGDGYYYETGCGTAQDCNDANATVYPGAPPLCDGLRNDCNDPTCDDGGPEDCDADYDGFTPCEGDCDDTNPFASPGGVQACDGANNDCNDPLWPVVPEAELDLDGDGFPACTGSCEIRATTDGSIRGLLRNGASFAPSLVRVGDGFAISYSFALDFGNEYRSIRLDHRGRRIGEQITIANIPGGDNACSSLARADVGFGVAWVGWYSIRFSLLGDDVAPVGPDTLLSSGGHAYCPRTVWNGSEFAVAWTQADSDPDLEGIYFARVDANGIRIGSPAMVVATARFGAPSLLADGSGYALAWLGQFGAYFLRLGSSGTPIGTPTLVAPTDDYWGPSLVRTETGYAISWTDSRSGNREVYLVRLDAAGQRVGEDIRVSNADGDSVAPHLVWSGTDFRVVWLDSRDGSNQIYFARISATGEIVEGERRVSLSPLGASVPTAAWSGDQVMIAYPSRVPQAGPIWHPTDLHAARENCHDCDNAEASVFPGAAQLCNGRNDDCRDPLWPSLPSAEADQDGDGVAICAGDCNDQNSAMYPAAAQVCDGVNNDCLDPSWPTPPADDRDADGDGGSPCQGDCNDSNAAVHPGAIENCNAIDDNCSGQTDEDDSGVDSDSDSVHNACDNCRFAFNPDQLESDGDSVGNACDNCVTIPNQTQADTDSDGRGNVCDNCPLSANSFQDDFDDDRVGDICDNCIFDWNATQTDFNHDGQGDVCDLNDGLIYVFSTDKNYREWQAESGYTAWNSYRSSLGVLRATGQYTQAPGSSPLAARDCGVSDPYVFDAVVPGPGQVAFNLVTGMAGGVESGLGTNSAGNPRANANPCP